MKKGMVGVVVAALAVALVLSSPAAYAYSSGGKEGKACTDSQETRHDKLFKDLNLTADQKKMLDENKAKHREDIKKLFEEMKTDRAAIRQELQKPELDMGKINQINDEMKKVQAQMLDNKLQSVLEVRKILTPEQFQKFMAKIEEHKGRFGKRSDK